ncbi:MAG: hypothetical protein COA52_06780 [Hyphomicrobiales bacterium]|nr:MAG: hypothetical protein COA52_06780 [Hyphomicrobiales bacterium]
MNTQSTNTPFAEVEGAIRSPANPNHFMVVQNVEKRVRMYVGDLLVADTTKALRVIEMSHHAYEPRFYIPGEDILADLTKTDTATHCPLKGDASYFSIDGVEMGWRYTPLEFAHILEGHYSFWGLQIRIVEGE